MLLVSTLVAFALLAPDSAKKDGPIVPEWAELIQAVPDNTVSAAWKKRIRESGYAWQVRHRDSGIEMLLVPPGAYHRGASPGDRAAKTTEMPRHEVTITRPFYLGCYEVQEHEWDHAFEGTDLAKKDGLPKAGVDQAAVDAYFRRLRQKNEHGALRLPTEAEWEYACRAGTEGPTYESNLSSIAWFQGNANGHAHVVGRRKANTLGFHDMLGNVWEWCSDNYSEAEYERVVEDPQRAIDPTGSPSKKLGRVLRGGSYRQAPEWIRASSRGRTHSGPDRPYGFRVAHDV